MARRRQPPGWLAKADSLFVWGRETGFRFVLGAERSIGLLIEWTENYPLDRVIRATERLDSKVAGVFLGNVRNKRLGTPRRVWALTVEIDRLDAFLGEVEAWIDSFELASPLQVSTPLQVNKKVAATGNRFLTAVLDDGCAFANDRFRTPAGKSRILWLWNQDPDALGAPLTPGNGPSAAVDFGYGAQWSKTDLDGFLQSLTAGEAYRRAGLSGMDRSAAHGTHVLDMLAGGIDSDIVFVQFPRSAVEDPTGVWLKHYALHGILYAIESAAPTQSIVVNISWGPQHGPHDGSTILEREMARLALEQSQAGVRSLDFTLPAGNSFQARAHACVEHRAGGSFDWLVPPDGRAPAFIQFWWPAGIDPTLARVSITPPGGSSTDVVAGTPTATDGTWWVRTRQHAGAVHTLLVVHPTGQHVAGYAPGRHGRWAIDFPAVPAATAGETIHAYVARADPNMGARRRAARSYLSDEGERAARFGPPAERDREAPGSHVTKHGTLNGLATGAMPYVVGGYVHGTENAAPYSSAGPTRGTRKQPDFSCVTDRSPALAGVRAAGVRSGTRVRLVGTSTAAPQFGKLLVTNLVAGRPMPTADPEHTGTLQPPADPKIVQA